METLADIFKTRITGQRLDRFGVGLISDDRQRIRQHPSYVSILLLSQSIKHRSTRDAPSLLNRQRARNAFANSRRVVPTQMLDQHWKRWGVRSARIDEIIN